MTTNNNTKTNLWYKQPARRWEEALPLGCGRLGAMVMGGVSRDDIFLNEDSIWSGKPADRINKDAKKYLGRIRQLIREGKIPEAEKLSMMALSGTPNSERSYETAGNLAIFFDNEGEYTDYRRELDLGTGIVTASYKIGSTEYTRKCIASADYQVIAYHIEAGRSGSGDDSGLLNFSMRLERCHNRQDEIIYDDDEIGFHVTSDEGHPFAVKARAVTDSGSITSIGEHLVIEGARAATIFIDIHTSFYDKDYLKAGSDNLDRASIAGWDKILENNIKDFEDHFNTMSLKLGDESVDDNAHSIALKRDLPTDERLDALKKGEEDPELFAIYFMYGRYLLFASSRGTCLPANLQGVWNNSMTPPWESKYTININAQMNYWIAESGNLSDCHMPFFELLKRVCENGKKTAEKMYGCRGSVAHHNTDIYADTAPQDHCISSTFWIMGEAWMATHIWEHYLYTGDRKFLNDHFYILDECVTFFKDFLIRNEEGKLVTSPSISPENVYIMNNGVRGCMCEAPTMDIEILTELLTDYIKAGQILDTDEKKIKDAKDILADLPEIKIGRYGQIQEWLEDYDEQEPGHRHISHLYGVYPGTSISIDKTPELMKAARKTLERRMSYGGGHTGWSRAWIIGLYAHFMDGDKVYENLNALLCQSTFNNLMDSHPYGAGAIFQIDGNFGAAAAMLEMLVQGDGESFRLLPALPKQFSTGSVSGLCLRGGYELSMEWKDQKVTSYEIKRRENTSYDDADKEIEVEVNGKKQVVKL